MTIRPFFAWFDCWVGFYWDSDRRILHFCPVPMVGIRIQWKQ